jgi:TIR domain/Pentapeptide repeats (8 copies)
MANPEHIEIAKKGTKSIAEWRANNLESGLDLSGADLRGINLGATYPQEPADLQKIDLSYADVRNAFLRMAKLSMANMRGTNLQNAQISITDLNGADLSSANLTGAYLIATNLAQTKLDNTNFDGAVVGHTKFIGLDLSSAQGLSSVKHEYPSTIDVDTLFRSKGNIPELFLRGCGVPDILITYLPSLINSTEPIQFYSCFISYSHKDEEFAKRLYSQMRDSHIRVWFAPESMKAGKKLYEQIDRAIQIHDRLLIVLSEDSLRSEWVITEIRKARKVEILENQRKLFPIRLVDMETLRKWECFDADSGKDLAIEVREYFIPDFSNWKDPEIFKQSFQRLLNDLSAT